MSVASAETDPGLGPLPIRNQFPIALQFLNITPDTPTTLPAYDYSVSYQMAIANTFINTRGDAGVLSPDNVRNGLEEEDFFVLFTPLPSNGFNLYVDVESYRQVFRVQWGLPFFTQVGLEWPLLSFGGGFMDNAIEGVHNAVGVDNATEDGGFRSEAERNRFDYYLIRGNRFLFQTRQPFDLQWGDPVLDMKWNPIQEEGWWPSVALKLAWKYPWDGAKHHPRNLISSGRHDYGVYAIVSKSFFRKRWILYWQTGQTFIDAPKDDYQDAIRHHIFSAEYRAVPERSWLVQWARQSSIFPSRSPRLNIIKEVGVDRGIGQPTDVLTAGVKQIYGNLLYMVGFSQDINQTRNETDFVLFFGIETQTASL